MSDVEETIMLVDADSMENGQGVVNVCCLFHIIAGADLLDYSVRKTKNGDVVCTRRWSYPRTLSFNPLSLLSIDRLYSQRYHLHREHRDCL